MKIVEVVLLKLKINILRKIMIHTGKVKGLTHPDTIKHSQTLDLVLNRYDSVKMSLGR
ncbi:aspartyl-phosphate phosphatase Spo0E family protein [Aquibacillus kalidii]|uniref:aspartyl-phosphate phosphatase Spo0E family protein n=1 Tax=Aquibacillus kalidii TaxID=2762597 RepID=UPI0016494319|nr:aspartyl-phosphate phosphatase Spo0E family protein [Aquibacillus kalidii]